jgi:hypothetical protein
LVIFQICKDKVEAEVWIAGLSALISSGQGGRSKIDGWCDGGLHLDVKIPLVFSVISLFCLHFVSCTMLYRLEKMTDLTLASMARFIIFPEMNI